jgi:2-methylcitrate dehydratase PrpD
MADSAVTITRRLAIHAAETPLPAVPAQTLDVVLRSLQDAVGVALAAGTLAQSLPAFVALARQSGQGPARLIGHGLRAAPAVAALVNGAMSHALDFEDTHDGGLVHPTGTAFPAALALADLRGDVSGREFLAAIAVGSDLTCRLGLGLGNEDVPRGWSIRPLLGTYGATAAAGRLAGLGADQMSEAFGLAFAQATCSAGVFGYAPSHMREVRDGIAAQAAVTAVLLAREGVRCHDHAIDDVFALYAGGRCNTGRLLDGLGEVFESAHLSFKPWPSCRGTHAVVEAALGLRAQHGMHAADIERVEAETSHVFQVLCEPVAQKRRPQTAADAKFSLPFTTAVALVHGRLALADFSPEALADPEVLALAARVDAVARAPQGGGDALQGRLRLWLRDGRCLVAQVDQPLGDPLRPMSDAALRAKFADCVAHAPQPWSVARIDRFCAQLQTLPAAPDLSALNL